MAKKRHHSSMSRKDRLESHDYYAGPEARRHQEREDGSMISEDHSAIANLPQHVMMKEYPRAGGYMPEDLNDTITGIDRQKNMDNNKRKEHFMPKKV